MSVAVQGDQRRGSEQQKLEFKVSLWLGSASHGCSEANKHTLQNMVRTLSCWSISRAPTYRNFKQGFFEPLVLSKLRRMVCFFFNNEVRKQQASDSHWRRHEIITHSLIPKERVPASAKSLEKVNCLKFPVGKWSTVRAAALIHSV